MSNNKGFKIINEPKTDQPSSEGPFAGVIKDAKVEKTEDSQFDSVFDTPKVAKEEEFDPSTNLFGNTTEGGGNDNTPKEPGSNRGALWNTIGVIAIILLLFGIGQSLKGDDSAEDSEELADAIIASEEEEDISVELVENDTNEGQVQGLQVNGQDVPSTNVGTGSITTVTLAMLGPKDFEGKKRACDTVVYREYPIPPTRQPLNAALRVMFDGNVPTDYLPGNFVAGQENLQFVNATLEGRTVAVNLSGEMNDDECVKDRVLAQIEETALRFDTIDAVEVYLNGNRL